MTDVARFVSTEALRARLRLIVFPGEVLRLPPLPMEVRILDGRAWLTGERLDSILSAGERLKVARGRHRVLVSAVGSERLVIEFSEGWSA